MQIEKASLSDFSKIMKLEQKVFQCECFDAILMRDLIINNQYFFKLIVNQWFYSTIIGYILCAQKTISFPKSSGKFVEILSLAIDSKYQNKGYGKILLNHIINLASTNGFSYISLEVKTINHKAISLYKSLGFLIINRIKNYYSNFHEDAYCMRMYL